MRASQRLTVTGNLAYTLASEEFDPLSLAASPEILEKLHWGAYDFSTWHTYVQLDSTSWDATIQAEARLTPALSGVASYTYLDFNDNDRYLENLTGNLDIVRLALRWVL